MRTGGRHLVVNLANLLLLLVVRPLVRRNRWYVSGGLAAPQIPRMPGSPLCIGLRCGSLVGWLPDCFWLPSTYLLFRWLQNVKSGEK